MTIGDRVRVLHGTEEGIVTRIIDSKSVEIEINEGFIIPVLKADLVTITDHEDHYFSDISPEPIPASKELNADKGIFIALELEEEAGRYRLQLINNTDLDILVTVYKKEGKLKYAGVFRGLILKRNASQISVFNSSALSGFNELYCQILYFDLNPGALRAPVERQVRMTGLIASNIHLNAPVINRSAWLKQIDDKAETPVIIENEVQQDEDKVPNNLIDLHAEALGIDSTRLSTSEILEAQIKAFNDALDKAIIFGLNDITFIHGVGQGTLKNRIIKEIKDRSGIRYWEDALKEKFGHGAIKIVFM